MKKLFIFLNFLLTACVGLLIFNHISYTPAPQDKTLDLTPKGPSVTRTGVFDLANSDTPGNLSFIYENNVFNPERGVEDEEETSSENGGTFGGTAKQVYTGSFELAGICKIDNFHGALITSSGTRRTSGLRAKFYRVNQFIGETGYKLLEITPGTNSVVIGNGRQESVLELDRHDSGSSKRRTSEVKKQELAAKKASLAFNKTKPVTPPPTVPIKTTTSKKKTAEEIAAIRRKILERMAEQKKKNKKNKDKAPAGGRSTSGRRKK